LISDNQLFKLRQLASEQIVHPSEQILHRVEQLLLLLEQMVYRVASHCPAFLWLNAMLIVAAFFYNNTMSHEKESGYPIALYSILLFCFLLAFSGAIQFGSNGTHGGQNGGSHLAFEQQKRQQPARAGIRQYFVCG
jgi:hypothetical protein